MNVKAPQTRTLEIIYTLFVGILVAVFVGVGIAAFYEGPKEPEYPATLKVYSGQVPSNIPSTASAQLLDEQKRYDAVFAEYSVKMNTYNKNVSIIALIASVILLTTSMVYFKNVLVIADGLLLGGVITLLYSVVRIFESGDDKVRFVVVAVGLVVALVLGYRKFSLDSTHSGRKS